jgi:serine/threonine protein kinase
MAPETVTRKVYGKACDVWGAGVMLHVLLSGRLPFLGSGKRLQESIARARVSVRFYFLSLDSQIICLKIPVGNSGMEINLIECQRFSTPNAFTKPHK